MQLDLFEESLKPPATLSLGGRHVPYTLRRSPKATRVWLKIGIGTGLEVVAPARMAIRDLDRILDKKAGWIQKNLAQSGTAGANKSAPPLKDGTALPYLGLDLTLRVRNASVPQTQIKRVGRTLFADIPYGDASALKEALGAWYKETARKVITRRLERLKGKSRVGRVSIRDQKTRWGSCSITGNLNFNWRLVMAPPRVIDYLILHELTHLEHPDHSERFWSKVAKRCPDYKERMGWLKKHGPWLAVW